jgi:hypothetical protein
MIRGVQWWRPVWLIAVAAAGLVSGCGDSSTPPPERTSVEPPPFVGKTWLSTDTTAAAGTLRAFLRDGTLVMTSCVETYRLARWRSLDDRRVAWEEDGARIEAEIDQPGPDQLHLRLRLLGEMKDEHYQLARVPFVCPDLRR